MPRLCDRIGVIGNGFVGRAIARGFVEHCGEVRIHDVMPERSTHALAEALDCDWTFVCVPTPADDYGRCNTEAVVEVLKAADAWANIPGRACRLVIKSTVPVGFTRKAQEAYGGKFLTVLHSPEFLTARCALVDFQTPARNIVGVPGGYLNVGPNCEPYCAAVDLAILYESRFPGVPCLRMSSDESELVKLAQNGFFATKVAYFNAIYQLAQATGCDFETVRAGMLSDGRIAHAHTEVPGPDSRVGYGGGCLRKDLANLLHMFNDRELSEWSWLAALQTNNLVRRGAE